jgi:DNA-binding NarL/FixJ family response regulator
MSIADISDRPSMQGQLFVVPDCPPQQHLVLIVEDMDALRTSLSEIVRDCLGSVRILEATNGQDALRLASSHKPDLIIMDISMPLMNGIVAARKIWEERPATKIVFWAENNNEVHLREIDRIIPEDVLYGYVLKTSKQETMAYAISSLCQHENGFIDRAAQEVRSRLKRKSESLSDIEMEMLHDIVVGLTDKAIARQRHLSVRGVQHRTAQLSQKLIKSRDEGDGQDIYNVRTRIIFEALRRGLIDMQALEKLNNDAEACRSTTGILSDRENREEVIRS